MSINEISKVQVGPAAGMMGKYFLLNAKEKARVLVVIDHASDGSTARFKFTDHAFGTIVDFVSGRDWRPGTDASSEATNLFSALVGPMGAAGWTGTLFADSNAFRFVFSSYDSNAAEASDPANEGYINSILTEFFGGFQRFYCYLNTQDGPSIDPDSNGDLDLPGQAVAQPINPFCLGTDTGAQLAAKIAAEINSNTVEFTATASGSLLTITHVIAGDVPDIADGNTGWTMFVDTQGA